MSKAWRSIVGEYQSDDCYYFKVLTVSPTVTWKWVKFEDIENDKELTQQYVQTLEYREVACQTDTETTQKQEELANLKIEIPNNQIQTFLPSFEDIVDPSYLQAHIVPSEIHKVDLHEKTAIVSYPNSSERKSIDLNILMSIDPVGVAKYLTSAK